MKTRMAALAAALLVGGMGVPAAQAGGKPAVSRVATAPATVGVEALRTADALVRYGDASKDALALITAAKIMKDVGSSEWKAPRASSATAGDAKPSDASSIEAILQRARALSSGRQDLLALADDVAKSGSRGGITGPQVGRFVAASGATDQYRIMFDGGQPAQVAVSGTGTSSLELSVYDQDGKLVCREAQYGDQQYCLWMPRNTETFVVKVKNHGPQNEYFIRRN